MSHWQLGAFLLNFFFCIERAFAGRVCPTGLDHVDTNILARQFGSPRTCHVIHRGFRTVVRGVIRKWLSRMNGTDHHDGATLLCCHLSSCQLAAMKHAPECYGPNPLDV